MKLEPARCPQCGAVAHAITETVGVDVHLEYDAERDQYEYAGEDRVNWDTQETAFDQAGNADVWRRAGHFWKARVPRAAEPREGSHERVG